MGRRDAPTGRPRVELPRHSEYIAGNSNQEARMRGYYCDFLHSPYWRALRRQVIAERHVCEECGCHNNLQVHHWKYDDLGTKGEYYEFRGLTLLCRACHAAEHGLPAEDRNWKGPEHIRTIVFAAIESWGYTYTTKPRDAA